MSNDPRSQYDCICNVCCKDYRGGVTSKVCPPCKKAKYPPKKVTNPKTKKLVDKG